MDTKKKDQITNHKNQREFKSEAQTPNVRSEIRKKHQDPNHKNQINLPTGQVSNPKLKLRTFGAKSERNTISNLKSKISNSLSTVN